MQQPKVSVIVPVYNCEEYLSRCVASLFAQTLLEIEFIFIDDCSTDNSYETLQELIANYPNMLDRVNIYKQDINTGIATVRNVGLRVAKGEFVGAVDADDWIHESMFEELYKKAIVDGAEIVWCDYLNIHVNNQVYISQKQDEDALTCIYAMMSGHLLGGMCNKLIKRELFIANDVRFPDGMNMCEDMRVNVQLFYFANKIAYLNKGLYYYVKYKNDSISTQAATVEGVNYQLVENVKGIVCFLYERLPIVDKLQVDKFKLISKKNLLVKGKTIEAYKLWRSIFPESNYSIQYTNYPFVYKVLAYAVDKEYWYVAKAWILMKYGWLKK